jgi:tetratricopeptide (TPR) repeat protein
MRRAVSLAVLICLTLVLPLCAHHVPRATTKLLPVTTSSPKARELYERAMGDYENFYLERANIGWRAAVKADPNFALAHAWIAFNSRNPEEAHTAREKAKAMSSNVTAGELLMIQWITSVQESKFIVGIAAMNDMLEMYPKDKRLFYLVGNWLMGERDYAQAEKLFRRALAIDAQYPAALNDLAYAYARNGQYADAFEAMDRYVAMLPNQPNPQDSYGELLRMSGNFNGGLEHYRAALKIDPSFITSQLGLGDTYALMGDESQARLEYDKTIKASETPADRLDYELQKAMTWVREGNFPEADKAYAAIAESAHIQGIHLEEAQSLRMMSLYQTDDSLAMKYLAAADDALHHRGVITESDREEERAWILRYRVTRTIHAANLELADLTLHELETLASSSRSMLIQSSYHGAAGALLVARQKFADAVTQLEDDENNPFSLELLSRAYSETGAFDKMHEVEAKLRGTNLPTMEQALVVPAARARRPE